MPSWERYINRDTGERGWGKTYERGSKRETHIEGDRGSREVITEYTRTGDKYGSQSGKQFRGHGWGKR